MQSRPTFADVPGFSRFGAQASCRQSLKESLQSRSFSSGFRADSQRFSKYPGLSRLLDLLNTCSFLWDACIRGLSKIGPKYPLNFNKIRPRKVAEERIWDLGLRRMEIVPIEKYSHSVCFKARSSWKFYCPGQPAGRGQTTDKNALGCKVSKFQFLQWSKEWSHGRARRL